MQWCDIIRVNSYTLLKRRLFAENADTKKTKAPAAAHGHHNKGKKKDKPKSHDADSESSSDEENPDDKKLREQLEGVALFTSFTSV